MVFTKLYPLLSPAFQVKDAREKLGQKDARFRIQARGGAVSAVQDARQTINSRKQQQVLDSPLVTTSQTAIPHIHIHNNNPSSTGVRSFPTIQGLGSRVGVAIQPRGGITKVVDARDRLSLKRSVSSLPSQGSANPLKITKTIQVNKTVLTDISPRRSIISSLSDVPLRRSSQTFHNLIPLRCSTLMFHSLIPLRCSTLMFHTNVPSSSANIRH